MARQRSSVTCTPWAYMPWRSRAQANPPPAGASLNIGAPFATRSNGGPDAKDESTTSSEATAGTALNSRASPEPESGIDAKRVGSIRVFILNLLLVVPDQRSRQHA